ncbi:MAG: hypothetical protein IPH20_13525 [Bacteroidales bacterium]|nr:hypothetical protein [Bacteroidales bacterium]
MKQLEALIKVKREEFEKLDKRQKRLEAEILNINTFIQFDNYSEIDWQSVSMEIQSLTKRKDELEKSNDRVNLLRKQLVDLQDNIKTSEEVKDKLIEKRTNHTALVTSLGRQQTECNTFLEQFKEIIFTEKFQIFEDQFKKELAGLNFSNLFQKQKAITDKINTGNEAETEKQREIELKLQTAMQNFKQPDNSFMLIFKDWTQILINLA